MMGLLYLRPWFYRIFVAWLGEIHCVWYLVLSLLLVLALLNVPSIRLEFENTQDECRKEKQSKSANTQAVGDSKSLWCRWIFFDAIVGAVLSLCCSLWDRGQTLSKAQLPPPPVHLTYLSNIGKYEN